MCFLMILTHVQLVGLNKYCSLIYLHNKKIGLPLGRMAPSIIGADHLRYRISPNQEHTSGW